MYRGASYIDLMRFQRCVDLWRRVLEIRIERDTILYSDTCFTAQALVRLMLDFNEKLKTNDQIENDDEQRFEDVVGVFKMLTENIVGMICSIHFGKIFYTFIYRGKRIKSYKAGS